MIIKISVRELRGLMASGSASRSDGANDAASPAGDGKTKEFVWEGRAFRAGSDHDIDRGFRPGDVVRSELETARMVADFNERAFRSGAGIFAKDTTDYGDKVGGYCSRPVYADVPPMPEWFPGGFPHGCPAAVFGRRFSGAFDSWLDAFDCVLRSLPGCDKGGRMLEVESYAVTDTDAVVRVFRLEGGVRCGEGPLLEERVSLKPWCVPGSDCGAYVDGAVSDEVDALVRGLGSALGFDGEQMARVRALAALGEGRSADERADDGGDADEKVGGKADEPEMGRKSGEPDGGEVERLDAALWERLKVMADSVNGLLGLLDRTRSLVANTVRGGDGDGHIVVLVQVRDEKEDWVRSRWWSVGAGEADMDGDARSALADSVAQGWALVVMRAVVCDDWTGWSERRPDGKCVRCDGSRRAETKDYEARDEEDAEESRREMAEAERVMAEDLGVGPARAKIDGRGGDEADMQDYDFGDVVGYVGTPEGHAHKERAARGGRVVSDFLRRFGLFADWVEGENGRHLVAETMPSDDWRRLVVSVTDAGTGRLLHACDYELFDENGARIIWLTTMNLCLFCLGLCETRFQERMRAEHIDVFPELEGGFAFGGDNKRYNDGGCDEDERREYGRVRVVAETIRGWLDALEGWSCARMPDDVGGLMLRVFPFVDHEGGETVRGGESVRLICRRCDIYTVFDVERRIPEGYGGMPMLRHLAVGMCAEMALALNGKLPWLDMAGFLRSDGGPDPEFNAEVLKIAGVPECDADGDGKDVGDGLDPERGLGEDGGDEGEKTEPVRRIRRG